MKLHLESEYSDRIIEAMKKVLNYEDKYIHEPCYCGLTVDEFVWDSTPPEYKVEGYKKNLKDIALLSYGNDTESAVNSLAALRFIGTGQCLKCGSNRIREHYEHFGMFKCQTCLSDFEDEKFMVSYNGVNYWQ